MLPDSDTQPNPHSHPALGDISAGSEYIVERQHVHTRCGVLRLSQQSSKDELKLLLEALAHGLVINCVYGDPVKYEMS